MESTPKCTNNLSPIIDWLTIDFDGDDMLGPDDIEEVIRRLLGDETMPPAEIAQLVQNLTV